MGEKRKASLLFVGKPERRPLEKPRCRWVNNKMDLGEKSWGGMDWIGLAWLGSGYSQVESSCE
jgi:hypothetical protein